MKVNIDGEPTGIGTVIAAGFLSLLSLCFYLVVSLLPIVVVLGLLGVIKL